MSGSKMIYRGLRAWNLVLLRNLRLLLKIVRILRHDMFFILCVKLIYI